jgi:hypothetical protein
MSRHVKSLTANRSHVASWERTQNARVWRSQGRLIVIVLLALTTYLALPATLYFTARLVMEPGAGWESWTLGSLVALVGSLVMGIVLSAMTKCTLCHGTPLLGTSCRKHPLANKLPLLTYRASTILHVLFTGRFRCMFCSTPFRLGRRN